MIPDKRLGQHFLTDRTILEKIVDALDPAPDDVVLEIGAGTGALTMALAPRVAKVVAVEKDRRLARDCGLRIVDCGITREALEARPDNPQSAFRIPQLFYSPCP